MLRVFKLVILFLSIFVGWVHGAVQITDSSMSTAEAFDRLHPNCPDFIRNKQELVDVKYYSIDGNIHLGQIVIDQRLADDIRQVFKLAFDIKFPIKTVIPVSDKRFLENGQWSDDLSMALNNTSAFNYREKTGGGNLSNHAYGWAIDINPKFNPYIKGNTVLPPGSTFNPDLPGTLTESHPIVEKFIELGWEWGGHWTSLKDYQHFEKVLK